MEGRVAIVTGAGRGIGRATALALAERGARVLGVSRTQAELDSLAAEAPVKILAEDVGTEDGCRHVVEEARSLLGPIEILVNNAGIGAADETVVWEEDPEVWHQTLQVNLDGPFYLTRLAAPDMVARRWGRIIMVSSTAGQIGAQRMPAYCASKHGLIGLMRVTAQDVGATKLPATPSFRAGFAPRWPSPPARFEAERRDITEDEVWASE